MRIALRVDIALGPIEITRRIHAHDKAARLHVAVISRQDLAVVCLLQQRRQPAYLELRPATDDEVSIAHLGNKAGASLNVVRILQCGSRAVCLDHITADLVGKRGPFGLTGKDMGFRKSRGGGRQKQPHDDI